MHSTADLDALLGPEEPHATFHDAELVAVRVDYQARELVAEWRVCVGNPDATAHAERERRRHGQLTLRGLVFWVMEPPGERRTISGPLWLTGDGPLSELENATATALVQQLPSDTMAWYLYFSDLNAFAYWAANSAGFQWA
jgi:hypothetical protein